MAQARKRVLSWQLAPPMKVQGITKMAMAKCMGTSRARLDRRLDPQNHTVQLDTLPKAAHAFGRQLHLELI